MISIRAKQEVTQTSHWQRSVTLLFFVLILLFLNACGTFQVGLEPEEDQMATEVTQSKPTLPATVVTSLAEPTKQVIEEPDILLEETRTPTEQEVLDDQQEDTVEKVNAEPVEYPINVAYVKDENVFLWNEANGVTQLTTQGGAEGVRISDDGQIVVFWRGQNLWAVKTDGSDEFNLTTQRDFADIDIGEELAPFVSTIVPYQVDFKPGSHQLFFNTAPQLEGPGLFLNDDLWFVDLDGGELVQILAAGEGGNFYFSPDGLRLAVVTPGRVALMNTDGSDTLEVLTHTPVITYSEFQYYVTPFWAPDSSSFMVAVPPVDPMTDDSQLTTIWLIQDNGTPARHVGNIQALPLQQVAFGFSPEKNQVIYLLSDGTTAGPGNSATDLAIAAISDNGASEPVVYAQGVTQIGEWSPGGSHFTYTPGGSAAPTRLIGKQGESPQLMGDGQSAISHTTWINSSQYLFKQLNGDSWEILLGGLGDVTDILVDSVQGSPPPFDIAGG